MLIITNTQQRPELAPTGGNFQVSHIHDTHSGVVYEVSRCYDEHGAEMTDFGGVYPQMALYGPGATSHRVPYCILYGSAAVEIERDLLRQYRHESDVRKEWGPRDDPAF